MTAVYPNSVRNYTAQQDLVNTVIADNVNSLQEEVKQIETVLGSATTSQSPLVSTWTGSFSQGLTWGTLYDRIANIEAGLVSGVSNAPYVSKNGGSTITVTTGTSAPGLTLTTGSGINNLITAGVFTLSSTGLPQVSGSNILYVGSSDYTTLTSATTAASNLAAAKIPLSTVTTSGDLIYGTGSAAVSRLGIGTSGQYLTVSSGIPAWTTLPSYLLSNTLTTNGDLLYYNTQNTRLGVGTTGQVLTVVSGLPAWANTAVSASDFATVQTATTTTLPASIATKIPLSTVTTAGDLIVGTGSSTVSRLGIGTSGYALVSNGTTAAWAIPTDTSKIPLTTVTTAGDLILGSGAGTVSRLGLGASGTVLTSNGTTATWVTPTAYLATSNASVTAASTSSGVVRNIYLNTAAPSTTTGYLDGDVWLVYV